MKYLLSLSLLLGCGAMAACNSTDDDATYEVADTQEVTLAVSGMT